MGESRILYKEDLEKVTGRKTPTGIAKVLRSWGIPYRQANGGIWTTYDKLNDCLGANQKKKTRGVNFDAFRTPAKKR